jgi:hypothetical protein
MSSSSAGRHDAVVAYNPAALFGGAEAGLVDLGRAERLHW